MKKTFKTLKFIGFLLFAIVAIIACDKDYNSIESDVIGLKSFTTDNNQIPIISYNKKLDSLKINNLNSSLLGVFNDPAYGQTTASIITQLTPSEYSPKFGTNPIIDSVVLTIPYFNRITGTDNNNPVYTIQDSLYGSAPIKLSIYQNNYFLRDFNPNEDLNVTQNYYSNASGTINATDNFAITEGGAINFDTQKGPLVYENDSLVFSSNAIILKTIATDGTEAFERKTPALRDTLNPAFWKALIIDKQDDAVLSNANNFYNYFRGLYFKAEAKNNDGSMILLDFGGTGSNITIYYSYDSSVEGADRLTDSYVLNFTGNRLNTFINNYNLVSLENGDSTNGDEKLYLKGTEGSMAVVDILSGMVDCDGTTETALNCFKKAYRAVDKNGEYIIKNGSYVLKKLINEAQLVIYEDENIALPTEPSDKYPDPKDYHKYDRIYAYDLKNNTPLIDYSFDPTSNSTDPYNSRYVHLGQRITDNNGENAKYKIRITEYLNSILLKDSTNTKIGLVLSTNVNYVSNSPILNSGDAVTQVPSAAIITPRGTVLYGNNENVPESKRMSLEIYFTKENTEN
ncbi:DUF4270 domain-containing protein [Gaetbulibacter sp. M235]|uniref:DUF4270 domain-containing protein n=1 Tax=Gaetbulibacter sp. M235 TaxID=3126510 RepID=UPI00374FA599